MLLLFSLEQVRRVRVDSAGFGRVLLSFFPTVERDLVDCEWEVDGARFLTAAFWSAAVYAVVFFVLFLVIQLVSGTFSLALAAGSGIVVGVVLLLVIGHTPTLAASRRLADGIAHGSVAGRASRVQVAAGNGLCSARAV